MKKYITIIFYCIFFCTFPGLISQEREEYDILNAQKSFFEGKYDNAINTLERVLYNGKLNKEQIEKIHLLFALCYLEKNQLYLAEEEIDEIYRINPHFIFDSETFSSQYEELFREVKAEVISAVKIVTKPDSADIYIDGVHKGISPLTINPIYATKHTFTAVKEKFELKTVEQRVFPAETTLVNIKLDRSEIVGIVKINSDPESAETYIDDVYKGQTPVVIGNLIPGRYKITLNKKGYLLKEGMFTIDPRRTKEIKMELEKNRDHFVFSEIFPGLGQFSKGYIKHGILFTAGTIGYISYYMKVRQDDYLSDPQNRLRNTWDGYYIGNEQVSKEEWLAESRIRTIKEKNHQERLTRAYLIGGAFYLVNLIDTVVIIRLDIRRKLREEQRQFALKLKSDYDKVWLSLSYKF